MKRENDWKYKKQQKQKQNIEIWITSIPMLGNKLIPKI